MTFESHALAEADQIGRRLCRQALWDGPQCTWLGLKSAPGRSSEAIGYVLGGDLYEGCAGVGYVLAELFFVTADAHFKQAAIGALNRSWARADILASRGMIGLFDGIAGVALAHLRCAALLAEPVLKERAESLLCDIEKRLSPSTPHDIISGTAGILTTFLDAVDVGPPRPQAIARCAELLMAGGRPTALGLAWSSGRGGPALTGYAHGAAGIVAALCAYLRQAPNAAALQAVLAGTAFENGHLDRRRHDWRDLRAASADRPAPKAWCHGAPGILLSRLDARAFVPEETWRRDVALAGQRTLEVLRDSLDEPPADSGLCHGGMGNAAILKLAGSQLGNEAFAQAAIDIAQASLQGRRPDRLWRSYISSHEETPQLMTGSAGVAHALLNLCDASPFPLILDVASPGRR